MALSKDGCKTALITGASGGIGEALALCFAQHGYRLVLIARNEERLQEVAKQCQELSQQGILVIVADLAQKKGAERIYQQVQAAEISVDVLINNAGIGSWGCFSELELREHERLIQINLLAIVRLSYLFLKDMNTRRQGNIVNIASVYAYSPVPYQAMYAASKAFMMSFSCALSYELRHTGISVNVICPGTTLTGFRKSIVSEEKPNLFSMSATQVAELAYAKIERNKLIEIPGFINRLFVFITRIFPMKQLTSIVVCIVYKVRSYKGAMGKR